MDWQIISSLAVAAATVALVLVTGVLAKETARMREAASQPHVVATIEPNLWSLMYFDLRIDNTGNAPAYDINILFEPPLPREEKNRKKLGVPLKAVSVLRPGQSMTSYLAPYSLVKGVRFSVTISWKREPAATQRQAITYGFDMNVFEGSSRLGENPLVQIAREVKHLRNDWQYVARGSHRLSANIFTTGDRQREFDEMEKRFDAQRKRVKTRRKPASAKTSAASS